MPFALLFAAVLLATSPAGAKPPSEAPLCEAASLMSERTKRRFVVDEGVDCATAARLPATGLPADVAARRFVLGLVGAGHPVVEGQGETRILAAGAPDWLKEALEECPEDKAPAGPLLQLRAAVDGKGQVLWVKLEATTNEGRPRGQCLMERARQAKLSPSGGATTVYSFPLGRPMRRGALPAEVKERLKDARRSKPQVGSEDEGRPGEPQGAHDHQH